MLVLRRVVAVVAVALTLVACGGNKNNIASDPAGALKVAASKTTAGDSVKMELAAKTGSIAVATGTGAYDFKTQTGRFTLTGALIATFDLVITPGKLYIKTPNAPKPWAAVTEAEMAQSPSAGFLSTIRSQIDPRETLRNLGDTTKNVRVVGTEKVRDADTTHIRADVDLSDAAIAKAPANMQDSLRQARQSIQADSYPIEVWLDKDGRVRKLVYSLTVNQNGQASTTTVELAFYDFGKDPGIVIPKASDVKEGLS